MNTLSTTNKDSFKPGYRGVLITSLAFSAVIGVGLYVLKQKHEADLDKLERDTANACLDVAAEHYERILRKYKLKDETIEDLIRLCQILPDENSKPTDATN